jgi:hypothetical protein
MDGSLRRGSVVGKDFLN